MRFDIPIKTKNEAIQFITDLHKNDLTFHFDDDPADIIRVKTGEPLFTETECELMRARVNELFTYLSDPFEILLKLIKRRTK